MGDEVLSGYGSGDFRARRCAHPPVDGSDGIRITTRSGRVLASTPEHVLRGVNAGADPATAHDLSHVAPRPRIPARHLADLHQRPGEAGGRGGAPHAATSARTQLGGVHARHRGRRAVCRGADGRRYGLPTCRSPPGPTAKGSAAASSATSICSIAVRRARHRGRRQATAGRPRPELRPSAFPVGYSHRDRGAPAATWRSRSAATIAAATPMHRIALFGYDDEGRDGGSSAAGSACARPGDRARTDGGLRPAARTWRRSTEWRRDRRRAGQRRGPATARLGPTGRAWPATRSRSPKRRRSPGMVMFDKHGDYDIVETVVRVELDRPVYDLDIEHDPQLHRRTGSSLTTQFTGFAEPTSATSSSSRRSSPTRTWSPSSRTTGRRRPSSTRPTR